MKQKAEAHLVELFRRLNENDQLSLLAFAEFLSERGGGSLNDSSKSADIHTPKYIRRPEQESVPAALKRLRETYPMLDVSGLLTEASELMSQHIVQGRSAQDVIDDLQVLFDRYYRKYTQNKEK